MTLGSCNAGRRIVSIGGDACSRSARTIGSVPSGSFPRPGGETDPGLRTSRRSGNGIQATPLPTRSVTSAFILAGGLISAPVTHTSRRFDAPSADRPVNLDEHVAAVLEHGLVRVSRRRPHIRQTPRREDERELCGQFLSHRALHTRKPILGTRNCCVRHSEFGDQLDPRSVDRLR